MSELPQHIFDQIIGDLFDQPVIGNLYRPHYVERMIALALGEGFELVSADWAGWDIESRDGARIEVKHSAAWQTWSDVSDEPKPSRGVYDISARTGHWTDGGARIADRVAIEDTRGLMRDVRERTPIVLL